MLHNVSIVHTAAGWLVHSDLLAGPLVFRSGAKAQDAACRVGRAIADNGGWAEIQLMSHDCRQASRFLCPPLAPDAGGGVVEP